jgi:hypothetical protein
MHEACHGAAGADQDQIAGAIPDFELTEQPGVSRVGEGVAKPFDRHLVECGSLAIRIPATTFIAAGRIAVPWRLSRGRILPDAPFTLRETLLSTLLCLLCSGRLPR